MNGCARAPASIRRAVERDAQPLDRSARRRKAVDEVTAGDRGLQVQRGGGRGLPLRLERLLRLVPRARQAGAAGRRRRGEGRDAGDASPGCSTRSASCCTRSCRSSPRSCGRTRRARGAQRAAEMALLCACRLAGARRALDGAAARPSSAGSSISSRRSARRARRPTSRPARRSRSFLSMPSPRHAPAPSAGTRPSAGSRASPTITFAESRAAELGAAHRARRGRGAAARRRRRPRGRGGAPDKERAKLAGDIDKIDAKLGNADFLARAPEEIVEEQRERRDAAEARRRKIEEALARLSAGMIEPA